MSDTSTDTESMPPEAAAGISVSTSNDGFVQALDPDGELVDAGAYQRLVDELDLDKLKSLYKDMLVLRRFDQEATALQRHGELALWPPSLGQEAAQIGLGKALRSQDFAFTSYREHGVALQRGVAADDLLKMFRGASHGGWNPYDHNMSTYEIMIGAQTLHATGYAMGVLFDGNVGTGDITTDVAVAACFGDGATSEGDVSEAFTFAKSFNAPVLFFCQNNQWAISVPKTVQTPTAIYRRGESFGIPGIRVDGNDVLAMYAVSRFVLDKIRAGAGPMLVEAYTYRMGAHTTADDPTKYRSEQEEAHWRAKDPLDRLEKYLRSRGVEDNYFATVADEMERWGASVRSACTSLPDPDYSAVFANVYAERHALVDEERDWYTDYEQSFDVEVNG